MSDKRQCSARVSSPGSYGSFHPLPCRHPAKVERDGDWYCTIHDPEYRGRKEAEANKAWEQQFRLTVASEVAGRACQQINPDNPRAVAESITLMWEALKAFEEYLRTNYPANMRLKEIATGKLDQVLDKMGASHD